MFGVKKNVIQVSDLVTQVSDSQKAVFFIVLRGSEDHALPGLRPSYKGKSSICILIITSPVRASALGARGQKPATNIDPILFYTQVFRLVI